MKKFLEWLEVAFVLAVLLLLGYLIVDVGPFMGSIMR